MLEHALILSAYLLSMGIYGLVQVGTWFERLCVLS